MPERFIFEIPPSEGISALVYRAPTDPEVSLILGHGAGAGQNSAFMVKFAAALAERGIETITFNFAYTEAGRRVPDRNDRLEAAWRRVIAAYRDGEFGAQAPRLAIGGKSMGGRIASQVFDHTSQLKLVSERFGIEVPNVSAWRRKTVGDLTSTLFHGPANASVPTCRIRCPAEAAWRACSPVTPVIPVQAT